MDPWNPRMLITQKRSAALTLHRAVACTGSLFWSVFAPSIALQAIRKIEFLSSKDNGYVGRCSLKRGVSSHSFAKLVDARIKP